MAGGDPGLEILWRHVLDHWDEDASHHAFLQSCQADKRLADAALRYRGMTGDHARAAIARKKLEAILVMALSEMESAQSAVPPPRSRLPLLIAVAVVGLALLLTYLAVL